MWLDLCEERACAWNATELMAVLRAFPRPQVTTLLGPELADSFDALEHDLEAHSDGLFAQAEGSMATEVGSQQATMFADRARSLHRFLRRLIVHKPAARLLMVGFLARLREMLADPPPLAIRIRSLVDFYYSHAAKLEWGSHRREDPLPSVNQLLPNLPWYRLSKGIRMAGMEADTRDGPILLHVLKVDQGKARFRATQVPGDKAFEPLHGLVSSQGGIAGFTGGFFLFSEWDITPPQQRFDPVGLLVSNGEVLNPPTLLRPFFFQDEAGFVGIARMGMKGVHIQTAGGPGLRIGLCNPAARRLEAPAAYTRAFGRVTPKLPGMALSIVGRQIVGVARNEPTPIPLNGFVLALPQGGPWDALGDSLAASGQLSYQLPIIPGFKTIRDAIAGGPTLLGTGAHVVPTTDEEFLPDAPPVTLGTDETGDQNMLPRLAIGLTPTFDVLVLAVDGRHLTRSFGATLGQMAKWMRTLGATSAINMDGGSSKRLATTSETLGLTSEALEDGNSPSGTTRRLCTCWTVVAENITGA